MFNFSISIKKEWLNALTDIWERLNLTRVVFALSLVISIGATLYFYINNQIVVYGDAESHLNIAKRVVHSITPGAAQLGGIWLPIPHIMLVPFVYFDFLWRTGLAGSIVSGFSFVVSSVYLYKTSFFLTKNRLVSFLSFVVFALNLNILYLQSTPMTELVLIMFFILSTYFFIRFIYDDTNLMYLLLAAFYGFCATLSRYDGWFLVLFQAFGIFLMYAFNKKKWRELEGKLVMFCTLAFFGIALWMLWDYLILGDPFFFTNSQFSAKTQQEEWHSKGMLPSYHNLPSAFLYYFVTAMTNSGVLVFISSLIGFFVFLKNKHDLKTLLAVLVLLVPFIFNVVTLFLGQSVIFVPHITPTTFEWTLFNVRYGVMMAPIVAFFFAYLFRNASIAKKMILVGVLVVQLGLYAIGYAQVVSLADGTVGLSSAKRPDAERWLRENYDDGLVLIDDYARTVSIIRSGIPMQNVIYIGNRGYWDESFYEPEKYATWIVMHEDDAVWKGIYDKPHMQDRLFAHFQKVYTSPEILIFKRTY